MDLCINLEQKIIWNNLIAELQIKPDVLASAVHRSCLVHSVFQEIFSNTIVDTVHTQSQLFANNICSPYSVAAFCFPFDGSPDSDHSLFRIVLHSNIEVRKRAYVSLLIEYFFNFFYIIIYVCNATGWDKTS